MCPKKPIVLQSSDPAVARLVFNSQQWAHNSGESMESSLRVTVSINMTNGFILLDIPARSRQLCILPPYLLGVFVCSKATFTLCCAAVRDPMMVPIGLSPRTHSANLVWLYITSVSTILLPSSGVSTMHLLLNLSNSSISFEVPARIFELNAPFPANSPSGSASRTNFLRWIHTHRVKSLPDCVYKQNL